MKYPEIGSEFWEYDSNGIVADHIPEWLKWGKESRFLLSGRTAIDHIIKDVRTYSDPKTVYLPSYCCQTMIRPFEMNGLIVSFYDVYIDNKGGISFKADLDFSPDILVSIDYFGYRTNDNQKLIRHFKEKGSIIIEDCTHSLFCYKPFDSLSDYAFAGFRKWMAIFDGAIVTCINNSFNIPDCTLEHESYLNA
ncbi:MAG: hypothetical protein IPF68_15045 [Bacteroidales bacterium]|nr:hypothetical protein [Bacteroidales bacterium]